MQTNAEEGDKLISRIIESSQALAEASARVKKAIDEIVSVAEENTAAAEEMAASAEDVPRSGRSFAQYFQVKSGKPGESPLPRGTYHVQGNRVPGNLTAVFLAIDGAATCHVGGCDGQAHY